MARTVRRTVLVVPDLHCPHQHPQAFAFLSRLAREYKPSEVVVIGDEIDARSLSRYTPDPDGPSPGHELEEAVKALRPLYALFPDARVCVSNHTFRVFRKAFQGGLPRRALRTIAEILDAPEGWQWADSWVIDGVRYVHGDGFSREPVALGAARKYRQSVVLGHVHTAGGVQYDTSPVGTLWGLSTGCLIDADAPAFDYARFTPRRPVLGAGLVIDGIPHFVPLR